MTLFSRLSLTNKPLLATLNRVPSLIGRANYASAGVPKVVYKKFEPPKDEHFEIRNEKLKRPLSPHLTIYAVQMTSLLSITHRITGLLLSGYVSMIGIGALVLPHDISHYIDIIESMNLSGTTLFVMKAMLAAPFSFHLASGIRHLYWDTGKGLTLNELYKSGYTILGFTAFITFCLAAL